MILPWHAHSQLLLHHSQTHLILPTKLHLISLLSTLVVSDSLVNLLVLLPLPSISLIAASLTSEEISLHYLTIHPTNKPASDSFPDALYKNYFISSLRTSSFTYLLTILTHPGKNGMAHLPPTLTLASNGSSPLSSPPWTFPSMPPYSVNLAYALVILAYSAHTHKFPQILSLQWHPLARILSKGSAFTRTSPTSSCI
jgi:hypothetical protein